MNIRNKAKNIFKEMINSAKEEIKNISLFVYKDQFIKTDNEELIDELDDLFDEIGIDLYADTTHDVKEQILSVTEKEVYEHALKTHKEEMKDFPQSYEDLKYYESTEYANARAKSAVVGEQWYWTQGKDEKDNQALKEAHVNEEKARLNQEDYLELATSTAEELYYQDFGKLPEYVIDNMTKGEEEYEVMLDDLLNMAQEKVDKTISSKGRDDFER